MIKYLFNFYSLNANGANNSLAVTARRSCQQITSVLLKAVLRANRNFSDVSHSCIKIS